MTSTHDHNAPSRRHPTLRSTHVDGEPTTAREQRAMAAQDKRRQERATSLPAQKRSQNGPRQPTKAHRCNCTFTYFRASSGLSGDACEQRGFSKVRVFLQSFSSERFFASADEDKTIAEKRKQHHKFSTTVLTKNDVQRQRPEKEKETNGLF